MQFLCFRPHRKAMGFFICFGKLSGGRGGGHFKDFLCPPIEDAHRGIIHPRKANFSLTIYLRQNTFAEISICFFFLFLWEWFINNDECKQRKYTSEVGREILLPRHSRQTTTPPRKGTLFTPYALTLVGGLIFGGEGSPIYVHYVQYPKNDEMDWMGMGKNGHLPIFCPFVPILSIPPPNDEMDRMGMGINGAAHPPYFQKISS